MSMEMLAEAWAEYLEDLNGVAATLEDVRDFCNIYASSYEEYTAMQEILECYVEETY